MEEQTISLFSDFGVIQILCFLNLTYLAQHFITFAVTKKLGRFYDFPALIHFTDVILFICSVLVIEWYMKNINMNLASDPPLEP